MTPDEFHSFYELAHVHCPIFVRHSNDQYFPITVDEYLLHCELVFFPSESPSEPPLLVAPLGSIRPNNLLAICNEFLCQRGDDPELFSASLRHKAKRHWQLRPAEHIRSGSPRNDLDSVPVYVRLKHFPEEERLEITYITHYSYNGSYSIGFFQTGHHDADIEHVSRVPCDSSHRSCLNVPWV